MKIVALEEHFLTPAVDAAWNDVPAAWREPGAAHNAGEIGERLLDLGDRRIAAMDEAGVDVQVLSLTAPALHSMDAAAAVPLQRETNDGLAEVVRRHPDRLQAFATLATPDPKAAARELERCVTQLGFNGAMLFGRTRKRNLDHADNWPIFEVAAALRAPLYLHPQSSTPAVRKQLYGGFGEEAIDTAFSTFAIGWHYEIGMQIVRMIVSGVFERFPDLQIVTGHWGEVVLFYLDRLGALGRVTKLPRPVAETFAAHVSVTASGMWNQRYFRWAMEVLGTSRIMYSTDYPYRYAPGGEARRFLEQADVSDADRAAIAHGNWDAMVAAIRR